MKSLRNPTKLKPLEKGDIVQVIVETPAGSRNKFSFDTEQGIFAHKVALPAGMAFPVRLRLSSPDARAGRRSS